MTLKSADPKPNTLPRRETVLVVEDEVLIRATIAGYLRECEYRAIEATNGDEALAVLRQPGIAIDVLFSDVEMPGSINGYALAQWVRAHRPEITVVLVGSLPEAAA